MNKIKLYRRSYRVTFLLFVLIFAIKGQGQEIKTFNQNTNLKSGIYTKTSQVYQNSPRFENYRINLTDYFSFNVYYNKYGNKVTVDEKPLIYVEKNVIWINYKRRLNKLILIGTISTFFYDHYHKDSYVRDLRDDLEFLYFDLITGEIEHLNKNSILSFLVRDEELHNKYINLTCIRHELSQKASISLMHCDLCNLVIL